MNSVLAATDGPRPTSTVPLLALRDGRRSFALRRRGLRRPGAVRAVDGVSVEIHHGRTLGIVGESGSGKSTVGRMLARLEKIDAGTLELDGRDVTAASGSALRAFRRDVQMVFQDPYGSLDPTKTAAHAITEPLLVHGQMSRKEMLVRAGELAERVALDHRLVGRYPDQLSGGQRQRVAIARALALGPRILVADEPTSALDLSTRSEIINLLMELQGRDHLSIVLISHDFTTVRHIAHEIAVMYLGRIVEHGPAEDVATAPVHPYTEALLSAVPLVDPAGRHERRRIVLSGDIPSPVAMPSGCRFRTRCPIVAPGCDAVDPALEPGAGIRRVACVRRTTADVARSTATAPTAERTHP